MIHTVELIAGLSAIAVGIATLYVMHRRHTRKVDAWRSTVDTKLDGLTDDSGETKESIRDMEKALRRLAEIAGRALGRTE